MKAKTAKKVLVSVVMGSDSDLPVMSEAVSYTHLRAHETPEHLVCRLLLEKKKQNNTKKNTTS